MTGCRIVHDFLDKLSRCSQHGPKYLVNFTPMAEQKPVDPDEQYMTYTIAMLGPGRWFVDSTKDTSGYSFRSLAEAERFAVTLAQRNTPSKVCTLGNEGEIMDELVFNLPTDTGR